MAKSSLIAGARRTVDRLAGSYAPIVSVPTSNAVFALTYDDGPHPVDTLAVLDELRTAHSHATFFVLLSRVRRNPQLLQEVLAEGHEIGLHGMDHRRLTALPRKEVQTVLHDGRSELSDLIGKDVKWFRPPYGAATLSTWRDIHAAGLDPVLWSASAWDWKSVDGDSRRQKIEGELRQGAVMLAHDCFPDALDGTPDAVEPEVDRKQVAQLIHSIASQKGLRSVTVSQLIDDAAPVRRLSRVK